MRRQVRSGPGLAGIQPDEVARGKTGENPEDHTQAVLSVDAIVLRTRDGSRAQRPYPDHRQPITSHQAHHAFDGCRTGCQHCIRK